MVYGCIWYSKMTEGSQITEACDSHPGTMWVECTQLHCPQIDINLDFPNHVSLTLPWVSLKNRTPLFIPLWLKLIESEVPLGLHEGSGPGSGSDSWVFLCSGERFEDSFFHVFWWLSHHQFCRAVLDVFPCLFSLNYFFDPWTYYIPIHNWFNNARGPA